MRQNQLARLLEMDETLLSRIVNGYRQPSAEFRKKISAILHSDEMWLFQPAEVNDLNPPGPKQMES